MLVELQESQVIKGIQGLLVMLDKKELVEQRELQENLVDQENKEHQVLLVKMDATVPLELQVLEAVLVQLVHKVQKEPEVALDQMEKQESEESLGHPEPEEQKDLLGQLEFQEKREQEDNEEHKDLPASKETKVPQDQWVKVVAEDKPVLMESQEFKEQLGNQESKGQGDKQENQEKQE